MKIFITALMALAMLLGPTKARAQEDAVEVVEEKDPCANISCSHHGLCAVTYVGDNAMPTCACDNGYTPDTVNSLSCQPIYQPPPQPVYQPPPQPAYYPPVSQPAPTQMNNPYSIEYYPLNTMTDHELRKIYRRNKVSIAFSSIFHIVGVGGIIGGIIMVLGDNIVGGAIIITLGAILVASCSGALGKIGKAQHELKKYMHLRGIAKSLNPYLAIRDDLLLQPSF